MELQDVLHFYLGCDCLTNVQKEIWELHQMNQQLPVRPVYGMRRKGTDVSVRMYIEEFKPILRPLSSMTEEEVKEFIDYENAIKIYKSVTYTKTSQGVEISYLMDAGELGDYPHWHEASFGNPTPVQFAYLLSKNFDLFGLIESGQAIDSSTL